MYVRFSCTFAWYNLINIQLIYTLFRIQNYFVITKSNDNLFTICCYSSD